MKKKIEQSLFFCFFFFIFLEISLFGQSLDAFWTLVFAGKNTTTPVFWNGNIYTAGEDRALNCISSDGKFAWRRNTWELPSKFISVSNSGLVYLISKTGNLEVFSSQGMPSWHYKFDKIPIFPVHTARDGRVFVILSDKIFCLTPNGNLKWSLALPSKPISPPAETGAKDVILILESGVFLRVSIFGKIVEQYNPKNRISALGEAPAGYILADEAGTISYYKSNVAAKPVWQVKEKSVCKKIIYAHDKVLYLFKNGRAVFKELESNKLLWEVQTTASFSDFVRCRIASNEFNIMATAYGCVITDKGKLKWERHISEKDFLPIITENGLLVGITKEFLNAYRMETKLMRRGKTKQNPQEFYSITSKKNKANNDKNSSSDSKLEIPFFLEYESVSAAFEAITEDLKNGNIGDKEPRYARQLETVLQNKRKAAYYPENFSPIDRAVAAELLGQMGSYEYRDILIGEINGIDDSTVLAGILRGLTALAYDPDGKTMQGIKTIMQKARYDDSDLMKAVIDCLEALIKQGDKKTAKEGILTLFSVISGPYSDKIKKYARQKIKNVV